MMGKGKPRHAEAAPAAQSAQSQPELKWPRFLGPILVLALIAASTAHKVHEGITDSPTHLAYDPAADTSYFWTESEFQYRYAKMAAAGRALPEVDRDAQYPEGVVLRRDLTTLMEPLCGRLFRRLSPSIPPHRFALTFLAVVSSLTIAVVYVAARLVGGTAPLAAVAAAYYASSPIAFERAIGSFEYETFTLPIFFLAFLVFCLSAGRPSRRQAAGGGVVAGALLVLALLSWHFAGFLAFGFFALAFLYSLALEPKDEAVGENLRAALLAAGGIVIASSVLLPSLRAKAEPFSAMAAAIYAYWICRGLLGKRRGLAAAGLYAAALVATAGTAAALNPERGMYGHVYALASAKLRFLLMKPDDPHLLSPDARALWIEAFNSPSIGGMLLGFFPALLLPLGVVFLSARKIAAGLTSAGEHRYRYDAGTAARDLTYLMGLFALALYAAIDRLSVFLIFFVAVLLAHALSVFKARSARLAAAALCAVIASQAWTTSTWDKSSPDKLWLQEVGLLPLRRPNCIKSSNITDLAHWLKYGTEPGAPVLASIAVSPLILTDAGRPILLNPKFESASMRAKYQEFIRALYGSEDELYRFAKKYGAKYLVYEPDFINETSKDSSRYIADKLTLSKDSAAVTLQFFPERLKRFRFVHQNSYYRIYAVTDGQGKRRERMPYYEVWYDRSLFNGGDVGSGPTRDYVLNTIGRINEQVHVEEQATSGDPRAGIPILAQLLPRAPNQSWMATDLATLEFLAGNLNGCYQLLRQVIARDPDLPYAHKQMAIFYAQVGRGDDALREAQVALSLDPVQPDIQELLGGLLEQRHRFREALAAYDEAVRLGTANPALKPRAGAIRRQLSATASRKM